jgi:hypothetical protein
VTKNLTEPAEREQVGKVQCLYCRDLIYADALICKTCGEPQALWRRVSRLFSTTLSSIVAIGSLGIAVLQYHDAKAAQQEASIAKAGEDAQVKASQEALAKIFAKLDPKTRLQVTEGLSRELKGDLKKLESKVQAKPSDTSARSDLLLHQFVASQATN